MKVSIFGSTGSIGQSALGVMDKEKHIIVVLTASSNVNLLIQQSLEWRPQVAVIRDEALLPKLKEALEGLGIQCWGGEAGLLEAAKFSVDFVVMAVVGCAALLLISEMLPFIHFLALASKEALVIGGFFLLEAIKKHKVQILPIDSEHNSIFQMIERENTQNIKKVILTASGGPFLGYGKEALKTVAREHVFLHPTWKMGKKITVDSACMMNKALEIIECCYLFDIEHTQVDILVHPQSLIHAIVHYEDGTCMMHASFPDMKYPLGHALSYPTGYRLKRDEVFDVFSLNSSILFLDLDSDVFRAPLLARQALNSGGIYPLILSVAGELAVSLFIGDSLPFYQIIPYVEEAMSSVTMLTISSLEDVIHAKADIRGWCLESLNKKFCR